MKPYHVAHLILTFSLSIAVAVFVGLLFAGVIEIRRSQQRTVHNIDSPRLVVIRGLRPGWEYRIFEGENVIGRADQEPVDIDLQPQERDDRVWSSRQHAMITLQEGSMVIEDLSTANGSYVNRNIVPPGTKRSLKADDVIQIGEVQLKVLSD